MKEDESVDEQYEIKNDDGSWNTFRERYLGAKPGIALEVSTTGKYVARLLADNGFKVHLANPKALKIIFKSAKKTDKNGASNLAKLLRLGELPESYLPSREVDDIRSVIRYRRSLAEESTQVKNRVHALLA